MRIGARVGAACVCVCVMAACHGDLRDWQARLSAPAVRRIAGTWQLELTAVAGLADSMRRTSGQVALTLNDEHLSAPGLSETPMFFGTYDVDFAPLGLVVGVQSGVPDLVATLAADSLVLVLAPGTQTAATLRGEMHGDSVTGRWLMHHRNGIDAVGEFLLRRH